MSLRKWVALFVCLACLTVVGSAFAAGRADSQMPTVAFSSALADEYARVQSDPAASEADKIKNVIDTLALAKYESIKTHAVIDIAFLYDNQHSNGVGSFNYEMGRTSLAVANEVYYGLQAESFNYRPEYESVEISGKTATVVMTPCADFVYNGTSGGWLSTEHTCILVNSAGQWKIKSNDYSDVLTEQYPANTNFVRAVSDFLTAQDACKALEKQWLEDTKRQAAASAVQTLSGTYLYKTPSGKSSLQAYARLYSEAGTGTSHAVYNKLFLETTGNYDCMNFASQCVWTMFGGNNTQAAIQGRYSPMVYNISGANEWWSTHTGATPSWTSISNFKNMLWNNTTWDKIGLQGAIGMVAQATVGDLVDHKSGDHIYVITDWIDGSPHSDTPNVPNGVVEWGELKECSHTNNHEDMWLHSTIQRDDANFTLIQRFKTGN